MVHDVVAWHWMPVHLLPPTETAAAATETAAAAATTAEAAAAAAAAAATESAAAAAKATAAAATEATAAAAARRTTAAESTTTAAKAAARTAAAAASASALLGSLGNALGLREEALNRQETVVRDVYGVLRLERRGDDARLGLDREEHLVDGPQDLVDLSDLRLVFKAG